MGGAGGGIPGDAGRFESARDAPPRRRASPPNTSLQAAAPSGARRTAAGIHRGHPMSEVTLLLDALAPGEPPTAAQLVPAVYNDLRRLAAAKLANEEPGQTLDPTALVHEAFLRL